jgi:hypothetical protein
VPESPRVPITLARLKGQPKDIAVDGTYVYVTEEDRDASDVESSVVRIPIDGGQPKVLATKQRGGQSIVATADALFWIRAGDVDRGTRDGVVRRTWRPQRPPRTRPRPQASRHSGCDERTPRVPDGPPCVFRRIRSAIPEGFDHRFRRIRSGDRSEATRAGGSASGLGFRLRFDGLLAPHGWAA